MIEPGVTVAIQAGGKSSRMGEDKSFVKLNGRPLIEIVIDAVQGLGQETILITNKPAAYRHLSLPLFADLYPEHGPLGGIYTAVFHASYSHTLIVACDMPWLQRPLLAHLITLREKADVVVPRWDKFPEPLHAVYSKTCLPPIKQNLEAGKLKITGFFNQVTVQFVEREELERFDGNGRSFTNINTPQDLNKSG